MALSSPAHVRPCLWKNTVSWKLFWATSCPACHFAVNMFCIFVGSPTDVCRLLSVCVLCVCVAKVCVFLTTPFFRRVAHGLHDVKVCVTMNFNPLWHSLCVRLRVDKVPSLVFAERVCSILANNTIYCSECIHIDKNANTFQVCWRFRSDHIL